MTVLFPFFIILIILTILNKNRHIRKKNLDKYKKNIKKNNKAYFSSEDEFEETLNIYRRNIDFY
tara:strand:- start:34 stop:225 length:192 start_codon:yes stop_codon:yes gene_type:complete